MAEESKKSKKKTKKSKSSKAGGGGDDNAATTTNIEEDNEPMNPALNEPDAKAIVLNRGDDKSTSVALAPTVSVDRKKELLIQARADRRKWVQQTPLPYASLKDPNNVWTVDDRLNNVQSSIACKRLPVATKVLSELYGLESKSRTTEEVAERVNGLIAPFITKDKVLLESNDELLAKAISGDDSEVVKAYLDFWSTLLRPECALLVQGMRNFLGNLSAGGNAKTMEGVAASLKSYVDSTYETLKSHVAWKDRCGPDVRRSLESFVYAHAQPVLDKLPWGGLFSMPEDEWEERVRKLQFVKPSHLEIECLNDDSIDFDVLLKAPVEAMLSIERFYSPYEKLQRILAVYQGVNAALSEALNQTKSAEKRKLPSADDVLPTIILVVLKAKSMNNMFRTLQFVENFSPQEYLRGEAGYAYTNLYGAVQFLHDLDMEQQQKQDGLSISPEEFRKHIEESTAKAQKRLSIEATIGDVQKEEDFSVVEISARDVRIARLDGDEVDFEWANKRQTQYMLEEHKGDDKEPPVVNLPEGFTRQYKFIGTRPEEVRVSDLPNLLNEYRTLVQVTEQLLGEKAARIASEKRKKDAAKSQSLDAAFFGIES